MEAMKRQSLEGEGWRQEVEGKRLEKEGGRLDNRMLGLVERAIEEMIERKKGKGKLTDIHHLG